MRQHSTQDLLIKYVYGEATFSEREFIAAQIAKNPDLHEELMELIRSKRQVNVKLKSPSNTSVRIIMEHSYKTEHLQEI